MSNRRTFKAWLPLLSLLAVLLAGSAVFLWSTDAQAWAISSASANVWRSDVSGFYAVRCPNGTGFVTDAASVRAQFRWMVLPRGRCPLLADRWEDYCKARPSGSSRERG